MKKRIVRVLAPPRRIRPTRTGAVFVGLSLAVGFAALNTGNNLLYLILGMMLSLITVSGVLSEITMRALLARRIFAPEVTAGRESVVTLCLRNPRRLTPAVGVWVEETHFRDVDPGPAFFVFVRAGLEARIRTGYLFHHRGKYRFPSLTIQTTYPFGLFKRAYQCRVEDEMLVFPPIEHVSPPRAVAEVARGEAPMTKRGMGEDFFGLRTFVSGDDPRRIHWKSSAKRATLLVREHSAQQRRRVRITLELTNPLPEEATYERGLISVVSHASHFLNLGYQVGIDVPGSAVPFAEGAIQLRRILRTVALAPRAGEAAEMRPSRVQWPPDREVKVLVAGSVLKVEAVA